MSAKLITIIIDLVALLFILSGFLFGLKRGLKESVNRLLLVLISAIGAILLTKALSGTFMSITLPFLRTQSGTTTSVKGFIEDLLVASNLSDTINIANFNLTVEAIVVLVKLISNLVVFLIIFGIFRFITWIIYMVCFRTKKSVYQEAIANGTPIKKHRWWGSLVGAFQGLFIFIFVFIPISGMSSVVAETTNAASAANTSNEAGIVETFVPNKYQSYLSVYENSIFNKAVGWTKFDELIFNTLTITKKDGIEISLKKEAKSINSVVKTLNKYEIIDAIKNKTYSEKLQSLSDEELKNLFTELFKNTTDFSTMKFLLIDSSNLLAEKVNIEERVSVSSIDWVKESEIVGNSLSDIISATKPILTIVLDSGASALTPEDLTAENVDYAKFGRGFDNLSKMQLIKDSYSGAMKKILEIEKIKQFGDDYGIDLSSLKLENISYEKTFGSVGGLLRTAVKLKNSATIENLATEDLAEVLKNIKELDPELTEQINKALIDTFEDETGLHVDVPENFNLFSEENEDLLDATFNTISSLGEFEEGDDIPSDKASNILGGVISIIDNDTSNVIFDVVVKATGVDSIPEKDKAKSTIEHLNAFISANDETDDLDTLASNLVDSLNENPSLIQVLQFKGNKYIISSAKMDALENADASDDLLDALFQVAE